MGILTIRINLGYNLVQSLDTLVSKLNKDWAANLSSKHVQYMLQVLISLENLFVRVKYGIILSNSIPVY